MTAGAVSTREKLAAIDARALTCVTLTMQIDNIDDHAQLVREDWVVLSPSASVVRAVGRQILARRCAERDAFPESPNPRMRAIAAHPAGTNATSAKTVLASDPEKVVPVGAS